MSVIALAAAMLIGSTDTAALKTVPEGLTSQYSSQAADPGALAPTDLEDVLVEGRRLEDLTRDFVRQVGSPARGRGLARWDGQVCTGVLNLDRDTSQYIADRIATVAQDLGLEAGAPGCTPNILVIAAIDSSNFTRAMVQSRPRLFSGIGSGMDLGYAALRRFQNVDRPVRWWNVSAPIDTNTGQLAVRTRDMSAHIAAGDSLTVPAINAFAASRLSTQVVDVSQRIFVILDVDKINQVSMAQLGDYLAMVTLAQIDPDAETQGYATVLNLFDDPSQTEGLTNWDKAYLRGLYDTVRTRRDRNSSRAEIVSSIVNVRRDMLKTEENVRP